jgi:Flp pilus assembly pilin Flp
MRIRRTEGRRAVDRTTRALYASVVISLIALVAVAAVTAAGQSVSQIFGSIAAALAAAA